MKLALQNVKIYRDNMKLKKNEKKKLRRKWCLFLLGIPVGFL